MTTIARAGQQAPGYAAGVSYISQYALPMTDDTGGLTYLAGVTGAGITTENNYAIFGGPIGNALPLVRKGDAAAGTAPGVVYAGLGVSGVPDGTYALSVNHNGMAAFRATLAGAGIVTAGSPGLPRNDTAIYVGTASPTLVARGGDAAPGVAGNLFLNVGSPYIDKAGRVVFGAGLTDASASYGVFRHVPDAGVQPLALRGQAVPTGVPAGVTYAGMSSTVGAGGDVAIRATLAGNGVTTSNDAALFVFSADGTPTLIAREGDAAVGGVGQFESFRDVDVNAAGQVVFHATLRNTGSFYNDAAVYVYDPVVGIVPIVREGDLLATDLRVDAVSEIRLGVLGTEDFHGALSDDGRVTFQVYFENSDSRGIFVATVPEPTTLAAFGLTTLLLRRRRSR